MITGLIYIAVVPAMYLVNSNSSKDQINNSSFYITLHKILRRNDIEEEQESGDPEQDCAEERRQQNGEVSVAGIEEDE